MNKGTKFQIFILLQKKAKKNKEELNGSTILDTSFHPCHAKPTAKAE